MKKFKELLRKKAEAGDMLSDHEKKARKSVLGEISSIIDEPMKEKLQGLKKVTVASDSPEGLQQGLNKARQVLKKMPEKNPMEEMAEELVEEDHEMMGLEEDPYESSEEEVDTDEFLEEDEDIAALEAKLAALKARKGR